MINNKIFLEDNLKLPIKTLILQQVNSTNTLCKELSHKFKEDLLVVSFSQTAGKGRLGRSFFSPKNSGIYMSFLLHPHLCAENCVKITTAAAVAAAKAIDSISGKNSLIKWVNDIYLEDKKVCGILTEAGFSSNKQELDYAVLGIGVNLYEPENGFPDDIKDKAGSVFEKQKPNIEKIHQFITEFTLRFLEIYNDFPDNSYMEEYRSRSFLNGKKVSFIKDGKEIFGTVDSIDDNAQLIVKTPAGAITLLAGEVSVVTI